jgi:hypothetical protein
MRKPIIGAAVAALALGGTAIAAAAGPTGLFGDDDPEREFAADLAAELDGVSAGEVESALESVAADREAERRTAMAEAIAADLEGVSADRVADAIGVAEEQMRKAAESGEFPEPGQFTATLADELGISEDEVEDALEASREQAFEEHRDELEQRLDEAVESGRLSEERADAMREGLDGDGPPMLAPAPGGHIGPGMAPGIAPEIPMLHSREEAPDA